MQNVKLNLIPGSVMPVVNVSQYDEGREFSLSVYEGATAYSLTGKTVEIRGTKPDGNGFAYDAADGVVSVSDNTATISTTQQMTAVGGQVMAELRITSGGVVLGTLNFIIAVEPSALSDDTPISDTDIPAIERLAEAQVEQAEAWATGEIDGVPVPPTAPQYKNSAKYWAEHTNTLDGLTDVDITEPTDGQALIYDSNSGEWINGSVSSVGDLDDLSDVTITTPADGDLLQYDDSDDTWKNSHAIPDKLTAMQENGAYNWLNNTATSQVVNGVTFTVNTDKSITLSNTATAAAGITVGYVERDVPSLIGKDIKVSIGFTAAMAGVQYADIRFFNSNNALISAANVQYDATFTVPANTAKIQLLLLVNNGKTATGTIYPMIYDARLVNPPYQPGTMTNRELTDALEHTPCRSMTLTSGTTYNDIIGVVNDALDRGVIPRIIAKRNDGFIVSLMLSTVVPSGTLRFGGINGNVGTASNYLEKCVIGSSLQLLQLQMTTSGLGGETDLLSTGTFTIKLYY